MQEFRKKLEALQQQLPMDLEQFVTSVNLPKDEDCFEFSYFQTFINVVNIFKEKGISLMVYKDKNTMHYRELARQSVDLSNPENQQDIFNVEIKVLVNGVGDHRIAQISYDGICFFIDPKGSALLKVPFIC